MIRIFPIALQLDFSNWRCYVWVGIILFMERDALVMLVARNLQDAMTRKGTNAAEVARNAGLNPTGVYDIISGKSRSPRLDTLHKIAVRGLGIPLAVLFSEPSEDLMHQELIETIGMMPGADRRRFLAMARALLGPIAIT